VGGYDVFDDDFGFLFNSYYQSVDDRALRAQRGIMTRPTVEQVYHYPGFTISKCAVGEYNGKFMVNQIILRGASSATSIGHSRSTYRNFSTLLFNGNILVYA